VVDGEVVTAIRTLAGRGVGKKAIAREVGVAVNTVRRYLRESIPAGHQVRPGARRLTEARRGEVRALYDGPAGGNAVVAQRLLAARGVTMSVRTIERAVVDLRRARRAAQLATVRVETPPGDQLQIDFGQKRVRIGDASVRVFLLVAVLSYSRRLFVKAFLSEHQDDWREGIAAAFHHFGGVPRTVRRVAAGVRVRHVAAPECVVDSSDTLRSRVLSHTALLREELEQGGRYPLVWWLHARAVIEGLVKSGIGRWLKVSHESRDFANTLRQPLCAQSSR
jgi:hypothetical protein